MKIVFTGLPYFGKKLVDALNKQNTSHSFRFYDTYYSKKDKIKFFLSVLSADLVVSFNGAYSKSKALDYVLLLNKKLVMQWHGTDVFNTLKDYRNDTLNTKYIKKSIHFTDSTFLKKQLNKANIEASLLDFKYLSYHGDSFEKKIQAVSYIAENREDFYGLPQIIKLANSKPQIEFKIAGIAKTKFDLPKNLELLGWVQKKEFNQLLKESSVFLRLTKNDGMSLSVLDALSYGCEVIWNQELTGVSKANDFNELEEVFSDLINKVSAKDYEGNSEAENLIKDRFNKEKVLSNYINQLIDIAKEN